MKKRNVLLALASLVSLTAWSQSLVIGNCNTEDNGRLEWVGDKANVGFASRFTRYKMRAYNGCQMKSVTVRLDGDCSGRVFVASDSKMKTRLVEKAFKAVDMENPWFEVVFDTPLNLDGKEVYIGYELDSAPASTLLYCSPLVTGSTEYMNAGDGWKIVSERCGMFYATVTGSNLPKNEVCLSSVSMPTVAGTEAFHPTAEIVNLGADNVTSLEVSYNIIGTSEPYIKNIDGLSIAPRKSKTVTLPELTLPEDGDYELSVTISKVNGMDDAAPVDNSSSTKKVFVRSNLPKRKPLLEVFSTERCTSCPEGHEIIEKALGDKADIIELCHHAGFYIDQFTIDESVDYEWFYKTENYTTSYAPAVMFDRTSMYRENPSMYTMDVPLFEPTATRLNFAYNIRNSEPALASLALASRYDKSSRTVSVDVDAEVLVLLKGVESPVLNVFLTEDSVMSNRQEGAKPNMFCHRNVARACLTTAWGENITNGKLVKTYTAKIDEAWDENKMKVVAFVSNYDGNSNCNCAVLNAESVRLTEESNGIVQVVDDDVVSVEYISPEAIRSQAPHSGMNIVVKHLANGKTTVTKRLIR